MDMTYMLSAVTAKLIEHRGKEEKTERFD